MSDYQLDVSDGVATVTINRPKSRNALTLPLVDELAAAIESLYDRDDVNVLVLTGAGGSFCAGADLMANAAAIQGGVGIQGSVTRFHRLLRAFWNYPRPTIAAVAGDAVGFGMDLALAADMRLAADTVRFRQGFSKIALVPDGGSSLTLQRLVGTAKAYELMYFSEKVEAEEALRIGLVNRVVPADELAATAAEWAGRLAKGPAKALRLAKANMRASIGAPMEDALHHEFTGQVDCFSGPDPMNGVMAWMNKAEPSFTER